MRLNPVVATRTEFSDYERRMSMRGRLMACHGESRALRIIAGEDEAARADEAAWRNIGQRRSGGRSQ